MNTKPLLLFSLLALTACGGSGSADLVVGLSTPSSTAYTSGSLNVQATVTGGTPDSLELLRDGQVLAALNAPYTFAWDTRTVAEGGYSLGVRAIKGGKIFQGEARTVFVDRTAPTISLTSNTAVLTEAGALNLSAEASDNRSVAKVEFFDGEQKVGESSTNPFTISLNLGSEDNREHSYTAKATDKAGNAASSSALKVKVLIPKRISQNLIVNGDAEAGPASASGGTYVSDLPSWPSPPAGYSRFTVVAYGTSGGFPSKTEAPPSAGNNFFAGGPASSFNASIQPITLPADWLAAIDAGTATFDLAGYFGGFGSQGDYAKLIADFRDAGGFTILTRALGPVSAVDRGGKTGFIKRTLSDAMPKQTRTIRVSLEMYRTADGATYNDGYADNLSLVLKAY